ncbi:MAG: endonuclease/exonuclease/phosphatase family protein [Anaerolineae bacterium]|nr:endonuclease/exonuclease/phosphatase family protein [Anaerolineae bacterium]
MTKLFSFAAWNVEHFKNDRDRIRENVKFIQTANPDIFAIFEVEGKYVFGDFVQLMPTHHFFITEGQSGMETLIGVNRDFTAFVTQRDELKSDIPTLRPGVLVTIKINDEFYSFLFLHLKSFPEPRSWGLRDDMIGHIISLKKALDRAPGVSDEGANFLCLGDFNTMGMNLTYSDKDMTGQEELDRYVKRLGRQNMKLLSKSANFTWWNGQSSTSPSNLDHVFASKALDFEQLNGAESQVRGWPELATTAEQVDWIGTHSDHAMLYGEVSD